MAPRENKNNAHAKFGGTNKEYYSIFESGLGLFPFSSKFPDLNFASYVLCIYLCAKELAWVTFA